MARKLALTALVALVYLFVVASLVYWWHLVPLGAFLWMAGMVVSGFQAMDAVGRIWGLEGQYDDETV
jgi:hypothetical protein